MAVAPVVVMGDAIVVVGEVPIVVVPPVARVVEPVAPVVTVPDVIMVEVVICGGTFVVALVVQLDQDLKPYHIHPCPLMHNNRHKRNQTVQSSNP